jgi:hypothetical protein
MLGLRLVHRGKAAVGGSRDGREQGEQPRTGAVSTGKPSRIGRLLDVDLRLKAFCCRYSSGRGRTPDYDAADAFVALCTGILHAEGACSAAIDGDPYFKQTEGAIWVPRIA